MDRKDEVPLYSGFIAGVLSARTDFFTVHDSHPSGVITLKDKRGGLWKLILLAPPEEPNA